MYVEVVATITSKVPITDDGLGTPEHSVDIEGGELMEAGGQDMVLAVVLGALGAVERGIYDQSPRLARRKAKNDALDEDGVQTDGE